MSRRFDEDRKARMSRLDIAAQRFGMALASLEAATAPLAGLRAAAADSRAKAAELSEERDRLLARIAELEEENRSLAGITEEVEDRLDGAIGEIRAALGR
jgi:hypothetical protein